MKSDGSPSGCFGASRLAGLGRWPPTDPPPRQAAAASTADIGAQRRGDLPRTAACRARAASASARKRRRQEPGAQVPDFHVDQRAFGTRERGMAAPPRAAQPGAFRVRTELIVEQTLQHEDFLAARVGVGAEACVRRPTHQRRADAVEFKQRRHGQTRYQPLAPGGLGEGAQLAALTGGTTTR